MIFFNSNICGAVTFCLFWIISRRKGKKKKRFKEVDPRERKFLDRFPSLPSFCFLFNYCLFLILWIIESLEKKDWKCLHYTILIGCSVCWICSVDLLNRHWHDVKIKFMLRRQWRKHFFTGFFWHHNFWDLEIHNILIIKVLGPYFHEL